MFQRIPLFGASEVTPWGSTPQRDLKEHGVTVCLGEAWKAIVGEEKRLAWRCWDNGSITCFLAGKSGKIHMEVKSLELDSLPIPLELLQSPPKTPVWRCFNILLRKCIRALLKVVPEQRAAGRSSSQSLPMFLFSPTCLSPKVCSCSQHTWHSHPAQFKPFVGVQIPGQLQQPLMTPCLSRLS